MRHWRMNFRQRMAWLLVVVFLSSSFGVVYYIFEINEYYNNFAVEHVNRFHRNSGSEGSQEHGGVMRYVSDHLADIPLAVWLLAFLPVYLQVFGMLLACTRAEPGRSMAFQWPGLLLFKFYCLWGRLKGADPQEKAVNNPCLANGYVVVDT